MKRFIDLRGQGTGMRFAWWDTVKDEFECFNHNYAWSFWGAFAYDYDASSEILRYRESCPEWAFTEVKEDKCELPQDFHIGLRNEGVRGGIDVSEAKQNLIKTIKVLDDKLKKALIAVEESILKPQIIHNNITITQPGDDKERERCSRCFIKFYPGQERINTCTCDKNVTLCRNCYNLMRNDVR